MLITITDNNGKEKKIGELLNRIFYKKVSIKKHLFKKLDAYGIDAEFFNDVLLNQADFIKVKEKETGEILHTTVKHFQKKGKYLHFKPHKAQIFLSRRLWIIPKSNKQNKLI